MAITPQFDQLPKRIRELIMADMGKNGSADGDATPFSFAMSPSAEVPRATMGPVFADDAARYTGTTGPLTLSDVAGIAPPQRKEATAPQTPEQGALTRTARAEPDFQAMLNKYVPEDDSRSRYLAMAAAFSKPTVTGSFGETMSNVSTALLEQKQNQAKLRAQYTPLIMQQVAAQQARDENQAFQAQQQQDRFAEQRFVANQAQRLAQERFLTGQADKKEMAADKVAAGVAAKEAAIAGRVEPPAQIITTPDGVFERTRDGSLKALVDPTTNKPLSGKPPVAMSPALQKELIESDDIARASGSVIGILDKALEINTKTYSGWGAKTRANIVSNIIPGKTVDADNTIILDNMVQGQALESLRAIFGGNPTEGERKILLDMQGSADKTPTQREAILTRGRDAAQSRMKYNQAKAKSIRNGSYLSEGVSTVPIDGDKATPPPAMPSPADIAAEIARRKKG